MSNLNLNKVILGGRITADPELRTTPSGISVVNFSVAINRWRSNDPEEPQADFINCTAWRQTAEFISKYFRKASSICIVGHIEVRSWQDKDGKRRTVTEVVVDEANFVDSKTQDEGFVRHGGDPEPPRADDVKLEEIDIQEELPF